MSGGLARRAAAALGVEAQARRIRRAFVTPTQRRNQQDDEQLRRLIMLGLATDSHCVDIGANVGAILRWITTAAPSGRHVAFEPVPFLRQRLVEAFPDVDVRGEALSDCAGSAEFRVVRESPSRSGLAPNNVPSNSHVDSIAVEMARLDDVLPSGFVPRLVKIDVEGAELEVLRGGAKTISSNDVLVAFEHGFGNAAPDVSRSRELYDLLHTDFGLRVFDMQGYEHGAAAFVKAYQTNSCWNFLARR
jgi:FkbM family methyltransferase